MSDPGRLALLNMARARVAQLKSVLPKKFRAAQIGVNSLSPFYLLRHVYALGWRTEELARAACDHVERGDHAVIALLARGVMENTAVIGRLEKRLRTRADYTEAEFLIEIKKITEASRLPEDPYQATNIVTLVRDLGKTLPGFEDYYNLICEVAHPNSMGVWGMFSTTDTETGEVRFLEVRDSDAKLQNDAQAMLAAVDAFNDRYNRIIEIMPQWVKELAPLASPPRASPNLDE